MGQHQHDSALRPQPSWSAIHRQGALRSLEDDHVHRGVASRWLDRAGGHRRGHERRAVPGRRSTTTRPHAEAGRHRGGGQPRRPQGRRRARSHRVRRCDVGLSASLQPRPESDRTGLLQNSSGWSAARPHAPSNVFGPSSAKPSTTSLPTNASTTSNTAATLQVRERGTRLTYQKREATARNNAQSFLLGHRPVFNLVGSVIGGAGRI